MDLHNAPTVVEQVIPFRSNNTLAQLGASASSSSFQDAGSAVAFHSVAKMAVEQIIADSAIAKYDQISNTRFESNVSSLIQSIEKDRVNKKMHTNISIIT